MRPNTKKYSLIIAFIINIGFILSTVFIHFLNPEYSFVQFPLSWYLIASYGFILQSGFLMVGFSEIIISLNLLSEPNKHLKISSLFLLTAGVGVIISGIFPIDHNELNTTFLEYIHTYSAAVQFIFFPLAVFLYSKEKENSSGQYFSKLIASVTAGLFILIVILLPFKNEIFMRYYGIIQKANILFITIWIALISMNMIKEVRN